MNKKLIVEVGIIFFALGAIGWGVFLGIDYLNILQRDNRRIEMVKKVQVGLENFYQQNGYYPGKPYMDENGLIVGVDWHWLITSKEADRVYNFQEFKDPCEPEKPVGILGLAKCSPAVKVTYRYIGNECVDGCLAYKFVVTLESGENKEFLSRLLTKK